MTRDREIDVMGSLLSDECDDDIAEVDQLNCLIYSAVDDPLAAEPKSSDSDPAWKTENDHLSVQVWETNGRIRIKVSPKPKTQISIKRLAEVALNAIMEDLKKDSS